MQVDSVRLLSSAVRERKASNLFKLAEPLHTDYPLRQGIHDGLLKPLTEQGGQDTDVTLGLRCQQPGLDIRPGDDMVGSSADGKQSIMLLVIDAEQDQCPCLRTGLDGGSDNIETGSARIQATFGEDISALEVTKVFL
ncbi:hypothetical protein ACX80E_14985 [Arthrobacter sp. TMN-49]